MTAIAQVQFSLVILALAIAFVVGCVVILQSVPRRRKSIRRRT